MFSSQDRQAVSDKHDVPHSQTLAQLFFTNENRYLIFILTTLDVADNELQIFSLQIIGFKLTL